MRGRTFGNDWRPDQGTMAIPRNKQTLAKGYEGIRAEISASLQPFAQNRESEKRSRRTRALKDLHFFAKAYFPHYLNAGPSALHFHLYEEYREAVERSQKKGVGARLCHAAPRGHAKSTVTSLILPLWCIVGNKRRLIGLLSDSTEQADEFLEFIKAELEMNSRLQEDFPSACGEGRTWKAGHIITANGVKLRCWGKRKRIRGARHGQTRPDLVICDDLEDDESVDSPEQRLKDEKWFFKAVMKVGSTATVTIVVGTLLHYDSLLAKLLQRPGWKGRKWQAVMQWSASPLWEQWEALYNQALAESQDQAQTFFSTHEEEMLEGTEVLWPEVESYLHLMQMRVSDGPAYFDSEKQNEPLNPEDCIFREEWFRSIPLVTPGGSVSGSSGKAGEREPDPVYAAVDPSMGASSHKGDPSAIVVGAQRPDGCIDILEADIARRHPDAIMEALFHYHERYRFTRVVVETVQFQELFKDHIIREGARRGLYLPIEGVRPTSDKILRITKLQPHIKNGLIRFGPHQANLLNQLKYFPKADHDDGPDALEMLFSLIQSGQQGPRVRSLGV